MGLVHSPNIVTNGLVLCLDAANRRSYPGTGTVWNDLSGNGNHGTLNNMDSTNYSSINNGTFIFDGSNERINCGNALSLQITVGTISAWFNATSSNSNYNGIIAKQNAWGLFVANNILIAYDWGGGGDRSTGINVGNNTWNQATLTFTETIGNPINNARIYLNGLLVLTTTVKHANHSVTVQLAEANSNQYLSGSIAQALIYNRTLSAQEILQNYNATRARFH